MADTGTITGQVLNQLDNQPIADAGAQVTLDTVQKNTTTNNEGVFTFTDLAPGDYALYVEKAGFYQGVYGPLVVRADDTTTLKVALQPGGEGLGNEG